MAKNRQKITFLDISGSVLSDFANFPASPLKNEKNAAFGSHVALSVLQIDLVLQGKSTYQSTTKNSPKPIPLPSPLFFSIFLVDSWTQIIQGSSVGHITIHFRGSSPKQGPQRSCFCGKAHIYGTGCPTALAQVA